MQPSEPGFYWATFLVDDESRREIVQGHLLMGQLMFQRTGSEEMRSEHFFTDWSSRLIDPANSEPLADKIASSLMDGYSELLRVHDMTDGPHLSRAEVVSIIQGELKEG